MAEQHIGKRIQFRGASGEEDGKRSEIHSISAASHQPKEGSTRQPALHASSGRQKFWTFCVDQGLVPARECPIEQTQGKEIHL